jgi:peroxiredoxin
MRKSGSFPFLMLFFALVLVLALGAVAYRGLAASHQPSPGDGAGQPAAEARSTTAPDFTVYDAEGNEVHLSDYAGQPVILNFWATWCGPCRSELPHFQAAWEAHGEEIRFLMVDLTDGSNETPESTQSFLAENGYTFPVVYDLDLSAYTAYSLHSIPMTVAVDAEGHIVRQQLGALTESTLQEFLDALS